MTALDVLINGSAVGSAVALVILIVPAVILAADTSRAIRRLLARRRYRRQAAQAVREETPTIDDEIEQMMRDLKRGRLD